MERVASPADGLLLERDGPVFVVTFDRAERLNALSGAVLAALPELWQSVGRDPTIRAIVITGAGERAFCAGMDLSADGPGIEAKEPAASGNAGRADSNGGLTMTPMQNDVWVPLIVAVNGLCVGGGLHFLCDADVILASTNASFLDTHVFVGQVAALEMIPLIPRIGIGNVLRLVTLGRAGRLTAEDALRVSLVDEVVAPDALLPRALELAHVAATASPTTVARSKQVIWGSLQHSYDDAMRLGADVLMSHRTHPDCAEGVQAFVEKRQPQWAPPALPHP